MGVDWARMDHRRSLLKVADDKFRQYDSQNLIENMNSYYQTAFGLMQSERAKKAFLIGEESEKLRDAYGRTSLGQGALLARRLVEAGVRYVTVTRGFNTWDHHANIFPTLSETFLPELDNAFSTLIEDLESRGHAAEDAGDRDRRIRPHSGDQQQSGTGPLGECVFHVSGGRRRARAARCMARQMKTALTSRRIRWRFRILSLRFTISLGSITPKST